MERSEVHAKTLGLAMTNMQVVNTPLIQVACPIVSVNMVTPTRVASVSETKVGMKQFNPYLTNGFSHHYLLDERVHFHFRGVLFACVP